MYGLITDLSKDGASETYSHLAVSWGQYFETGNTKRMEANNTRIAVPAIDKDAPDLITKAILSMPIYEFVILVIFHFSWSGNFA